MPYATDAITQKLLVVGLNGALQKRFVIQNQGDLVPGNVHRASAIQTGIGGKGQDVAIALHCLQSRGVQLLQFVGQGAEGDAVYQLMSDRLGKEAICDTTVRVKSHMRTCTSIVGRTDTTELVEPSGTIESDEMTTLLEKCEGFSSIGGICIMGSMPPGCSDTTYSEIYQRISAKSPSPLCVMDSVAGVSSVFEALAGPTIYKVNAQELAGLVGLKSGTSLSETIPAFLKKFQPPKHLRALAITDGKRPAHLCWLESDNGSETSWELFPLEIPKLDADTLYPIGAGDAVAAGTLAAWMSLESSESGSTDTVPPFCREALLAKTKSLEDGGMPTTVSTLVAAFAFGLACGSASCLQEENSVVAIEDVLRLFRDLRSPAT
jgi:fructose-1-phosphate kinase PfkB-like protein